MTLSLVPASPSDYPALHDLWERSVRATHHFLAERDIAFFRPLVLEAFAQVDVTTAFAENGQAVGFIGLHGESPMKVEMLFVDPPFFRKRVGRRLLEYALGRGATEVDVNEQNPGALRFYQAFGFVARGRSPLDGTGRPFPLLHLCLASKVKAD